MRKWIAVAMGVAVWPVTAAGPKDHANDLVYDPVRRQVVLITASDQSKKEELWTWDGRQWSAIPSSGPPARGVAASVYDTRQKSIVLFGGMGFDGQHKGDTWQFDGKSWREMPDTSVGVRDHHAMAFDEARGVAVMYGGGTKPGTAPTISDVWEWNGARWARIPSQGPGPRSHTALVYDPVRKKVILFGGQGEDSRARGDTWAWDGKSWEKLSEEGPVRRTHHRMAFDRKTGTVVLYGGLAAGRFTDLLEDTWIWDGKRWTEAQTSDAGKRMGHVMAFDESRGKVVLYGGGFAGDAGKSRYEGTTFEWDGRTWTEIR